MLHDLGWDIKPNSPFTTGQYYFEVDSGRFAMEWIKNWTAADGGSEAWDYVRLQKVNLGIMFQTAPGYADFSFIEAQWIMRSIEFEFPGIPDMFKFEWIDGIIGGDNRQEACVALIVTLAKNLKVLSPRTIYLTWSTVDSQERRR